MTSYNQRKHLIERGIRIPFPCNNDKNFEFNVSLESKVKDKLVKSGPFKVRNISSTGMAIVFSVKDEAEFREYNETTTPIRLSLNFKSDKNNLFRRKLVGQVCAERRDLDSKKKTKQFILNIQFLFLPDDKDHNKKREAIEKFVSLKDKKLKIYLKDPAFRDLVKKEIELKKNESLYKYLDRVLRFMGSFINYDVGMVGYVVPGDQEKKVISVEDTVFVGDDIKRAEQIIINDNLKFQPLSILSKIDLDKKGSKLEQYEKVFNKNQEQEHSCMAHSQQDERIYYIKYPNTKGKTYANVKEKAKDYIAYWKENKCKKNDDSSSCMNVDDFTAACLGKFNRADPRIRSEITIPIRPWLRCVYRKRDKEDGRVILISEKFFGHLKDKDISGVEIVGNYTKDSEGSIYKEDNKDKDLIVANKLKDSDYPCVLLRKLRKISYQEIENILKSLYKEVKEFSKKSDIKKEFPDSEQLLKKLLNDIREILVQDEKAVLVQNEVIALLHFESISSNDSFNESIREILKIIRQEAEIEIAGALNDHYSFFRKILYRSITTYLMGEPQHALIELGKWREVQCSNIFNKFDCLRDIFYGYIEFLKREVDSYFVVDKKDKQDEKDCYYYSKLMHINRNNECPDSRANGRGGVGLLFNQEEGHQDNNSNLTTLQSLHVSLLQLHFTLQSIKEGYDKTERELKRNKYSIYLKKAGNIASQIKQEVNTFIRGLSLITVSDINWNSLYQTIKDNPANLENRLLTSRLNNNQLEEFESIKDNQLTGDLKNAFIVIFNKVKDDFSFCKDDVARQVTIDTKESKLINEYNKWKGIIDDTKQLNKLEYLRQEQIKWFNIAILKTLFPQILTKQLIMENNNEKNLFYGLHNYMECISGLSYNDIDELYIEDDQKTTYADNTKFKQILHPDFYKLLSENTDDLDLCKKRILKHLLHMTFFIGISQINHIVRQRDGSLEMTLNDFEVMGTKERVLITRFIGTCSLLILSESVTSTNEEVEDQKQEISIPVVIGYMYRAKAFLMLGKNQRAFNDFIRLDHLIETRELGDTSFIHNEHDNFKDWVKVQIHYNKGKIYYADFAKSQALTSFCNSMETLKRIEKESNVPLIPRITTIKTKIYKGKTFFEKGSYSRSLKWYLRAVQEIIKYLEIWWEKKKRPKDFIWCPFQDALLEELIKLLETFKHHAIIDRKRLKEKLINSSVSVITAGDILSWKDLVLKISDNPNEPVIQLLISKLKWKEDQLEIFNNKDGRPLTNEIKEDIAAAFNTIKDDLGFCTIEIVHNAINKSDGLKKELNRLQDEEILDNSGSLKIEKNNLSYSQTEEIKWFNIVILKNLFPNILSESIEKNSQGFYKLHMKIGKKHNNWEGKDYEKCLVCKLDSFEEDNGPIFLSNLLFPKIMVDDRLQEGDFKQTGTWGKLIKLGIITKPDNGGNTKDYCFSKKIDEKIVDEIVLGDVLRNSEEFGGKEGGEKIAKILSIWGKKEAFKPMGKMLSGILNRIGFILFDLRLSNEQDSDNHDIALGWVEKALLLDDNNGYATYNMISINEARKEPSQDEKYKEYKKAFTNIEHFHSRFNPIVLHWLKQWQAGRENDELESDKRYYSGLLRAQLKYFDDLIRKPAEIYEYLTRGRTIPRDTGKVEHYMDGLYFLGRYSSWTPKIPRPRVFAIKGGGKFLVWKSKGIVIDPGFDFLNNFYAEGFSLEDIDAVIVTHDHHDHTDDFESMWRLIKEHNAVIEASSLDSDDKEKRYIRLTLFVNLGFLQKCSRFLSLGPDKTSIVRIYPLSKDTVLDRPGNFDFKIQVTDADHKEDLTKIYPVGFVLHLYLDSKDELENAFKVGFTSDTKFHKGLDVFNDCNIIVPHISNAAFRELKSKLGLDTLKDNDKNSKDIIVLDEVKKRRKEDVEMGVEEEGENQENEPLTEYHKIFNKIESIDRDKMHDKLHDMGSILKWSFWYRDANWIDRFLDDETTCKEELEATQVEGLADFIKNNSFKHFKTERVHKNDKEICELSTIKEETNLAEENEDKKRKILEEVDRLKEWADKKNIGAVSEFAKSVKARMFPGVLEAHLGASGIYKMWNEMLEKMKENWEYKKEDKERDNKLIVIGEFREEMGSFRSKVAELLNNEFEKELDNKVKDVTEKDKEKEKYRKLRCFTSEIGMAIHFKHTKSDNKEEVTVKIQCSSCRHDNDLYTLKMDGKDVSGISFDPKSTFHDVENIKEVCIKGDSEAMVYLCKEHVARPKGLFIEHMDRYDLFNSEGSPL